MACTFIVRLFGGSLAQQFVLGGQVFGFVPLVENLRDSYPITVVGLNPTIRKIIALTPILTRLVGSGVIISSMKIFGL